MRDKDAYDKEIDQLLEELDTIASNYDCELGFPKGNCLEVTEVMDRLRETVRDWLYAQSDIYEIGDSWDRAMLIPDEWGSEP